MRLQAITCTSERRYLCRHDERGGVAGDRGAAPAGDPQARPRPAAFGQRDRRAGRGAPGGRVPAPEGAARGGPGGGPPPGPAAPLRDAPGRAGRRARAARGPVAGEPAAAQARGGGRPSLRESIHIDAPPESVYEYFTRPDLMVRWMGEYAHLEPQRGGPLSGANTGRGGRRGHRGSEP